MTGFLMKYSTPAKHLRLEIHLLAHVHNGCLTRPASMWGIGCAHIQKLTYTNHAYKASISQASYNLQK